MGRVGCGQSLSWAEFDMGRDVQLPCQALKLSRLQSAGCNIPDPRPE